MAFNLSKRPGARVGITMAKFCAEARTAAIPLAVIRAVDEVESAGSGFFRDGRPKILCERHYFYKILKKDHGAKTAERARAMDPTVCNPNRGGYVGGMAEYGRLAKMTEICHSLGVSDAAALRSASWGRYQIMGENFRAAGYATPEAFVEDMFRAEDLHLEAFVNYVEHEHLDDELRDLPRDPERYATTFAAAYNGPAYRRNSYHIKIPNAWRRFERQKVDCSKFQDSAAHVVQAMPAPRPVTEEAGLEGTSLDSRYEESPAAGVPSTATGDGGGLGETPAATTEPAGDAPASMVAAVTQVTEVEQLKPEPPKDETPKEDALTKIGNKAVSIWGVVGTTVLAIGAFLTSTPVMVAASIIGAVALCAVAYMVVNAVRQGAKDRRDEAARAREAEAAEKERQRVHELQVLTLQSAMSKKMNTVRLVPAPPATEVQS